MAVKGRKYQLYSHSSNSTCMAHVLVFKDCTVLSLLDSLYEVAKGLLLRVQHHLDNTSKMTDVKQL